MSAPRFIFAIDHRPILAAACAERGAPVERVSELKLLAVEAANLARALRPGLADHMGILLDDVYGAAAIERARAVGLPVGQPAEKGGAVPLEFERPDWRQSIVGARPAFLKVRFDGRPDSAPAARAQEAKVVELSAACAETGVPFMPEPLISPPLGGQGPAESEARAVLMARWLPELRAKGVRARWWKLEGFETAGAASRVAEALGPGEGILVLGKSAPLERVKTWFAAAAPSPRYEGFAVGRTLFWQPFLRLLEGAPADELVGEMRANYLAVLDAWVAAKEAAGVPLIAG